MDASRGIGFVESLEIEDDKRDHIWEILQLAGTPRAAYVDDGSAISFVANVSPQSQRDTLNSALLAQLAANVQFDRESDTVNWYSFYRNVLENIGWVIQDFNFTKFHSDSASFTMDKVVLDVLAAIASQDEVAVVQATIDAMRALDKGDGRLTLFESESHSASAGNLQICVANEIGGILSMKIAAAYFSSQQNVTNVLWFSFSSGSSELYTGSQNISLNKQIYGQVRSAIVQKLGDKATRFVNNLNIG